jgi:hypothetical protein
MDFVLQLRPDYAGSTLQEKVFSVSAKWPNIQFMRVG